MKNSFQNLLLPSSKLGYQSLLVLLLLVVLIGRQDAVPAAETGTSIDRYAGYEEIIKETHKASLEARAESRRKVLAKDELWPYKAWGDTMWALVALYENEKIESANKRLRERAQAYNAIREGGKTDPGFRPETSQEDYPWSYFALADYVRILHLFGSGSEYYPGRLEPEAERAMKEALWWLVKTDSKVEHASLDNLLVLHGTENHDLTLRPNYYLVAALLKEDPAFKERPYDDGQLAADHYNAYKAYFRAWPRMKARVGFWFEMGSDTYQKYSWPALFNLHELSPDPLVREAFGKLLDLALIEEAQVAFKGRRGGGRSRAGYGKNSFEYYKNLLYVPESAPAVSSHSKVIETSRYQAPGEAILLRKMAFPADEPFIIYNRVPGELEAPRFRGSKGDHFNRYVADSALVNYVYRTPHYILGSTLQDPSLSMPSGEDGKPTLKYSGISRQNRWSGMLFCDPDSRQPLIQALKSRAEDEVCTVYPEIEKTRGGRPQHPFWSFQHENVLLLQRITPDRSMGSYSTGKIGIRFHGQKLEKIESDGWIFASDGRAHVAVKFLDSGYEWDETGELASPTDFDQLHSTTRYLLHSGDMDSHPSFQAFQASVLANPLTVEHDRVLYRASPESPELECFRYMVAAHAQFKLPRVGGEEIDLRPDSTYRSPYLNAGFGEDKVSVTVGPLQRVIDFRAE